MKKIALFLAPLLLAAVFVAPQAASAKPPKTTLGGTSVPINFSDATGSFAGTLTVDRFTTQNGALAAVTTVAGTVTNAAGVTSPVSQTTTLAVLQATGTCHILHLELGPLDLNLLGLVVHLDKVVLDITAVSGPGNLLGNLLCAVAGLLDSNAPLNQLVSLLNQLLGLLG